MKFSIIIPSFNQDRFISETFENLKELKSVSMLNNIDIEILLFDNNSKQKVRNIIRDYKDLFDHLVVQNDDGQYDALNKGLKFLSGDYWTWLNTDDLIDINGFLKLTDILFKDPSIDYIYGNIEIIDERSEKLKTVDAAELKYSSLINIDPGIYQPGSFFRTSFTQHLGQFKNYQCCFDYEFVLRALKNNAKLFKCNFRVSKFRLYNDSKSGSLVPVFIHEQLKISGDYGRKAMSRLTLILRLRQLKRFFIK